MSRYRTVLAVAAVAAATAAWAQLPFSLDTTFRTQVLSKNVNSVAVLPSGKILASGRIRFAGDLSDRGSARLNADGSRDLTFTDFNGGGKLAPWGDRYYVGIGQTVRRLLSTGYLDPSFVQMNSGPYFLSLQGGDFHVYPDGRLLISGTHTLSDTVRGFVGNYDLIWFSNEGYLDTTRVHRRGNGVVYEIEQLPNKGFICTSTCTQWEGHAVDWIFKVDSLGLPDTTFRTDVYVGQALCFLPLEDGRVYAGGSFRRSQAPNDTLVLVRFMPDGSLDPGFSMPQFNDGTLNGPFIGPSITAIYAWGPDQVLVLGMFKYVNGEPRNGICMLDTSGVLLPQFDGCGSVDPVPLGGPISGFGFINLTVDTLHNHIYLCGSYTGYNDGVVEDPEQAFITRLFLEDQSTGTPSLGQAPARLKLHPNPASTACTVEYAGPAAAKGMALVISDMTGRLLRDIVLPDVPGERSFDVRDWPPGMYTVELRAQGRTLAHERVVVNK